MGGVRSLGQSPEKQGRLPDVSVAELGIRLAGVVAPAHLVIIIMSSLSIIMISSSWYHYHNHVIIIAVVTDDHYLTATKATVNVKLFVQLQFCAEILNRNENDLESLGLD